MFEHSLKERFPFSAFTLKMVALVTMVVDHLGLFLYQYNLINEPIHDMFRQIGRISFILFAFTVAISIRKTSNKITYLKRLLFAGLILQLVYLIFSFGANENQSFAIINIFITLFLGALTCYLYELPGYKKLLFLLPLAVTFIHPSFYVDYSFYGVGLIFIFYILNDNTIWQSIILVVWNVLILQVMPLLPFNNGQFPQPVRSTQFFSILAIPYILLYNGKRGYSSTFFKYFFYLFYPLHLAILYVIFKLVFN